MGMRIRCPKCRQLFEAAGPDAAGHTQCPHCGQRLKWPATVPAARPAAPAEAPVPVRLVGRGPAKAPPRGSKRLSPGAIIAIVTGGLVVAGVAFGVVYWAVSDGTTSPAEGHATAPPEPPVEPPTSPVEPPPPPPPPPPPVSTAVVSATDMDPATLFAKASPAAVCIEVMDADYQKQSQGSGFLVTADGVIVTNHHVMRAGRKGLVRFGDDKAFPVTAVLAQDEKKDLAVLKIDGTDMPYLALLPKDTKPAVGTRAFAIGTPSGYTNTFSEGLVSGLREHENRSEVQTTADIGPGSSGGPLMDARARVIGVNTYLHVQHEGATVLQNLRFAVSSNDVHQILAKALATKARLSASAGGKPLDPGSTADLAEAYQLIGKNKWLEAATLAQALRKKNPENLQVLLLEGLLDVRMNFQDQAMQVYEAVTRLSPNEPEGHLGLGMAYVRKKMWKEAADPLTRAIKLRPEDASAQQALGQAMLQLGRKAEALETLKESVRLDDHVGPAWALLGEAYMAQNLSGPAEEAFRKAVELKPDPMVFAHLAMAAYQNGRFEEALKAAETAVKMQPGLPYAYYVMGMALHRTGRKEQAEQIVEMLQKTDADLSNKLREAIKATPAPAEKK